MRKVTTFLVALFATTALWAGTSNFTSAAFTVSADGSQSFFRRAICGALVLLQATTLGRLPRASTICSANH